MAKLTPREQRFCREYVVDLNATQAGIRAGLPKKSAATLAGRILHKSAVRDEIAFLQRKISQNTEINAAWLLKRLGEEADADLASLFDGEGRLKDVAEWPEIFRKGLVSGFKVKRSKDGDCEIIDVKLSDRVRRLELIGRHVAVGAWDGTPEAISEERFTLIRRVIVHEKRQTK